MVGGGGGGAKRGEARFSEKIEGGTYLGGHCDTNYLITQMEIWVYGKLFFNRSLS